MEKETKNKIINLDEWKEVESEAYRTHTGERIIHWNDNHIQRHYIKTNDSKQLYKKDMLNQTNALGLGDADNHAKQDEDTSVLLSNYEEIKHSEYRRLKKENPKDVNGYTARMGFKYYKKKEVYPKSFLIGDRNDFFGEVRIEVYNDGTIKFYQGKDIIDINESQVMKLIEPLNFAIGLIKKNEEKDYV